MVGAFQYRRLFFLTLFLVAGFGGLAYRLVDLQILRHERLSELAGRNTRTTVILEPLRGDIRDINGNLLAGSVFAKNIGADPTFIGPYRSQVARTLAPLLDQSEREIYNKLELTVSTNSAGATRTNLYVRLQKKVRKEQWETVRQAMANLDVGVDESLLDSKQRRFLYNLRHRAVYAEPVEAQIREYPNKYLAAHVLGMVTDAHARTVEGQLETSAGLNGVERQFNKELSGVPGWRRIERVRGKELAQYREYDIEPQPGMNVVLSLDARVQGIVEDEIAKAYQEFRPKSVSSIVVRPRTGEILALANIPTFDPNRFNLFPTANLRNRAITDLFEPGSTFKIVVVSGALNDNRVGLHHRFDCENGRFRYAGRWLHDHNSYGVLSVENIITKSSNIGAAKIAFLLGEARLREYILAFGYGSETGIPLLGESHGAVYPLNKWTKLSISRIPMGHEVMATLLQTTMAMSAIANDGTLMKPMLVNRLESRSGEALAQFHPRQARQVISPDAARQMVQALKTVVTPEGTAPKAELDHYLVAGKTGTTKKAFQGSYSGHNKYYSSFVGFFPADDPEVCVSVAFDEPDPQAGKYGGQTGAPVFARIAERIANYLNIQPDEYLMTRGRPNGTGLRGPFYYADGRRIE